MRMVGKGGGLALLIVTIREDSIMKIRTQMATIPTGQDNQPKTTIPTGQDNQPKTTNSEDEDPKGAEQADPILIKWEEWALSAEEHYHALVKYRDNPRGRPMGHKA